MGLFEPLQDGHGLSQNPVWGFQGRDPGLRIERAVSGAKLLAVSGAQVYRHVVVAQSFELQGNAHPVGGRTAPVVVEAQSAHTTPRRIWSSSMDSNSALKLPSPKPSLPLR